MQSVSSSEALSLIRETKVTRQLNHEGLTSKGRENPSAAIRVGGVCGRRNLETNPCYRHGGMDTFQSRG